MDQNSIHLSGSLEQRCRVLSAANLSRDDIGTLEKLCKASGTSLFHHHWETLVSQAFVSNSESVKYSALTYIGPSPLAVTTEVFLAVLFVLLVALFFFAGPSFEFSSSLGSFLRFWFLSPGPLPPPPPPLPPSPPSFLSSSSSASGPPTFESA